MTNKLEFQELGDSFVLTSDDTVLFIAPEPCKYASIISMSKFDFVTHKLSGMAVLAQGELDAIEQLYSRLEGHTMTEVRETVS